MARKAFIAAGLLAVIFVMTNTLRAQDARGVLQAAAKAMP
jgi:hypothetical protein